MKSEREKLISKIMRESRAEPEILRRSCAEAMASGVELLRELEARQTKRGGITADELKSTSSVLRSIDKLAATLGIEVKKRSRLAEVRAEQAKAQNGSMLPPPTRPGRKEKLEAENRAQAEKPKRRLQDLIEAKKRGISVEQAMAERIAAEKATHVSPDDGDNITINVAADAAVIGAMTPEQRLDALLAGRRT